MVLRPQQRYPAVYALLVGKNMARQRMVNTKFWNDTWVRQKLNPLDRYLFLYLLTNEHTNICGIYELPLETMAFESGIDEKDLKKSMLPRLKPKVIFRKGWVIMPNFIKNQNQRSPLVQKGIANELSKIPKEILEIAKGYRYPIASNLIKSNLIKSNVGLKPFKRETEDSRIRRLCQ